MPRSKSPARVGIESRSDANGVERYRAKVWDKRAGKHRSGPWTTNLSEARGHRLDLQSRIAAGGLGENSTTRVLDAEMAELLAGMESGAARTRSGTRYKPSVCRLYSSAYRLYLAPFLGHCRVAEIRRKDIQMLVDRLAQTHESSTVRNAIMPLRAYFRWAWARERVAINPLHRSLELPASDTNEERANPVVSPSEAFDLIEELPIDDRAIWATMFFGGLRVGEVQALAIDAVDLLRGVIRVEKNWDPKEGLVAPKSPAARRAVPIETDLRGHLEAAVARVRWSDGLLFGRDPSTAFAPSSLTSRAYRTWAEAGMSRVTPHQARHTYASWMIEAMVEDQTLNQKVLSEMMGHASIAITQDRYGHLMPGSLERAAVAFDNYLARARLSRSVPNSVPT